MLSKADIAEMFGVAIDDIDSIEYNNVQYYTIIAQSSTNMFGMNFSLVMTSVVHIDDGWLYFFQFGGTNESKYYEDFESLLRSVKYPGEVVYPTRENVEKQQALIVVFFVIICIVVFLVYKKRKNKKEIVVEIFEPIVEDAVVSNSNEHNDSEGYKKITRKEEKG